MVFAEHSFESFQELIAEIMALGYDRETAGRFAVLIGDMPVRGEDGRVWVRDGETILAKLDLKFFDSDADRI